MRRTGVKGPMSEFGYPVYDVPKPKGYRGIGDLCTGTNGPKQRHAKRRALIVRRHRAMLRDAARADEAGALPVVEDINIDGGDI